MERSQLSGKLVSTAEDQQQNWEVLLDDLTEAIDEFYTQYLCDPQERKETLRRMMLQGLTRPAAAESAEAPNLNVELIALETQLEQAQQNIRALENSLEEKARALETQTAESSGWREQCEAFKRQHDDNLAAIQLWKARTQEALAAKAQPQEANPADKMSDFAAKAERFARSHAGKSGASMTPGQLGEVFDRAAKTLDILLQAALKLMHGRLNFRDRYIDEQQAAKPADALLHRAHSADELKAFVFTASLSEAEFSERLRALKRELVQLSFHQLALLNGYRACVSEGSRKLLEEVEPDTLQHEAERRRIQIGSWQLPNPLAPLLARGQSFLLYRRRYNDLLQEDRSYLFEKIFHPGFMRGYQACMDAIRKMPATTLNFSKANGAKAKAA